MSLVRQRVVVRGLVQGVGFRNFVQKQAIALAVKGWVQNCPDGSVEAFLVGDADKTTELLELIRRGPRFAKVESVDVQEASDSTEELANFEIRRFKNSEGK